MKKLYIIPLLLFLFSCTVNIEDKNSRITINNKEKVKTIEEKITNIYSDEKKRKIALNFAKELSIILINKDIDPQGILEATDCMSFNMLGKDIGLIESLVFDTPEKNEKYINYNSIQSGNFFGGGTDLNKLDCNF